MKLLLDTHILLWAAAGVLPKHAIPYIADTENILFFSSASIWEIIIKKGLNRPDFKVNPSALYRGLLDNGYNELFITSHHVLFVEDLPLLHKDPFDRILIAQARAEGTALLSSDKTLADYTPTIFIDT